ncbi:MAG: ATP-dependent DNA helicase RecG [Bacteroidetes bacterium]|nr:ATP-dependent DNA helicase RecG [Bacteroidota bacterium]
MNSYLEQDIKFLPGVGPKRAELFNKELNIRTVEDLLLFFPYKYIDRSKFYTISEVDPNLPYIQIRGKITRFAREGQKPKERLIAKFTDGTGVMDLVFFKGLKYILDNFGIGKEYIILGKPNLFNGSINIVHPEIESVEKMEGQINASLQPFYNTTEKLKSNYITSRTIQKFQNNLWKDLKQPISETLPHYLLLRHRLTGRHEALFNIHFPQSNDALKNAQFRLKFEELFLIQLDLLKQKYNRYQKLDGLVFSKVGETFNTFYNKHLPFELTNAQKRVIKEIRKDLGSGKQMNRLVQGDVGSGKTLVALMTMLIAIDNGYQTCMMAPTEILANQHFNSIKKMLGDMHISVELLTGSTPKKKRTKISEELNNGNLNILIGTHALIEDTVQFSNLGFVIIDEQHRFGVAQRAKLWGKNQQTPHVLVMTATPIPRTLAMTLYGDLDISAIDELPPGRKPIKTIHYYDTKRLVMFGFLRQQIELGRQIYIVYPLIKESEKFDYKDLEDGYNAISQAFPPPRYVISVVHGKMKANEKEYSMRLFKEGKTQIMVATTVIEVGVDVPNASVMVIESAERFGLSQLHQLRGRVGRGAEQSYCILMSSYKLSEDAKKRLEAMVSSSDGFEIAELDLKLRGPGDLEGTQQSGLAFDLKIANLAKDGQILQFARDSAIEVLENDPLLLRPENQILIQALNQTKNKEINWGQIS